VSVLLLDASVWLASLDADDRHHDAARTLVERAGEGHVQLAALDLTFYEVTNVAVAKWRAPADAGRLDALIRLTCPDTVERVDERLVREAIAIAAEHGITVYDAAYVAAARQRAWTLVSGDFADLVRPGLAVAPGAAVSG
jgi:predicted nucleic acid-binding protein